MNKETSNKSLVPEERIEQTILIIRNQKVILDSDLAVLYGVKTKNLNKAIQRNIARFPSDFMFQLNKDEAEVLRSRFQIGTLNGEQVSRSQIVTLKRGQNIKYLPYVFTEHGALMAANVLNSERATVMSVVIVRTFVKLRQMLSVNKDLTHRVDDLEEKYDGLVQVVGQLMKLPEEKGVWIEGFHG